VTFLRSLRSPPAKNVFLALVITTPVIESFSASRRSTVFFIEAPKSAFMVLALWFGSSRTRLTTPSPASSQRMVLRGASGPAS
jgi:hypothetical protein